MSRDQPGVTADRCPPARPQVLREYALLADGERGALVDPHGEIAWLCAPRWDSDAVFSALLGGPGRYLVQPAEAFVWGGYYEPGTLIWRNRWIVGDDVAECREALAFPGDPGRLVLLRRITAVTADAQVRVVLGPRAGFGAAGLRELHHRELHHDEGCWHGRAGPLHLRWQGGGSARVAEDPDGWPVLSTRLDLAHGESHDLVLEIGDGPLPHEPPRAEQVWRATEAAWARATAPRDARMPTSAAPRDATHAVAVLRGSTSASGGMVAAATTSLPERFRAGRNYDYRYVWVRDQCYAGQAAAAAGVDELLDDAVRFLTERVLADGAALAPAYTAGGGRIPDETPLDLPGYPGSRVRTGNRVNAQFQLDAFGEILLLLAAADRRGRLDADGRRAAEVATSAIAQRWNEPDAGVWELDDRRWTHSRLLCVAGLRAIAACPSTRSGRGAGPGGPDLLSLADRLLADTAAHATHASGRWQRAPEDPGLDGALLLAGVRGAVPADDPRTVATVAAYLTELVDEGYAYRFRHDERPLDDAEGAFLLCNFLVALAADQQGDRVTAARFFDRGRSAAGPPGLFSEEFDVGQRQLRGNLPQAFVHALLLEAAVRLDLDPPGTAR
ncbi:glycoside hydrolase family 15 protein [Pseudonocardia parietis]|uniref:GH15 family glucan-1,4-alpha-glucosidase n=1 Tax=Pseudonocardia parietis TaxID=570936 RepID=A0ABS4W1Q9_9PSEU|nr:glycoside hydrolase family 15 protein [Pseudonocardia parietis]MBP2370147.1 hypothetical protein [Pseudonocardia parietis]